MSKSKLSLRLMLWNYNNVSPVRVELDAKWSAAVEILGNEYNLDPTLPRIYYPYVVCAGCQSYYQLPCASASPVIHKCDACPSFRHLNPQKISLPTADLLVQALPYVEQQALAALLKANYFTYLKQKGIDTGDRL